MTNSELKKAPVDGGRPVTLGPISPVSRGASWGFDDRIVVAPTYATGLMEVPAGGGAPELLTTLDWEKKEANHMWPQVLPNGDVVFTIWRGGSFDEATVALLSRRTGELRTLVEGGSAARVTRSGHLVFARGGSLLAAPFDPERGTVTGSPVPVLDSVMTSGATGSAQFSISEDGTLAYLPSGPAHLASLTWVDLARQPGAALDGAPRFLRSTDLPGRLESGSRGPDGLVGPRFEARVHAASHLPGRQHHRDLVFGRT